MKATSYISSNYIFLFYAVHFIHDLLYMTIKYYSILLDALAFEATDKNII